MRTPKNHLHLWAWLGRNVMFFRKLAASMEVCRTRADIGLCLKVRRAGYLIVYTPFAKLNKHELRADKIDMGSEAIMRERWPDVVQSDPYYYGNLSRERADF
jgi:hypothetical protein